MTRHDENSCELYELQLEDAAELSNQRGEQIALSADLTAHVEGCAHCSEALEAISVSQTLLRRALEPTAAPGPFFAKRVMAVIRAEENRLAAEGSTFWSPMQHLASRIAMVAGVLVMGLTIYAYTFSGSASLDSSTTNATAYELVPHQQLDPQPQSKDEVLMSLAERNNVERTNGR